MSQGREAAELIAGVVKGKGQVARGKRVGACFEAFGKRPDSRREGRSLS